MTELCPTPGKVCYTTKRLADSAATVLAWPGRRIRGDEKRHLAFHSYLCRCDHWHLTSKETS